MTTALRTVSAPVIRVDTGVMVPVVPLPASAIVARAQSSGMPAYVDAGQARAIIDAATRTRDRLLVECLWQSGGRVSEVCRLRRSDIDPVEGALVLTNLKQRRQSMRRKRVYVSGSLIGALMAYCADAKVPAIGYVFISRIGDGRPISRQLAWKLITGLAARAGVSIVDTGSGLERPATGLDFRHGSAVNLLRSGVPITEVSQHLGHARLDTTMVYARLTNAERRRMADRVTW